MGWAVARFRRHRRRIARKKGGVGIVGDGSLQTNIQELQTIAHHRLNIKLFIVNNGGYASIRNTQNSFFKGYFVGSTPESGVTLPQLSQIAAAYGIPYVHCENRGGRSRTASGKRSRHRGR